MFDYESPIKQFETEMQMEYENGVLKAIQNVGFFVDKEELIKALVYDRGQYEKGYEDGFNADKWIPCSERLPECEWGTETKALLFQMAETNTIHCGYYGEGGKYRDKYFRTYTNATDGFDAKDVIAWQPLPAPYQKGE